MSRPEPNKEDDVHGEGPAAKDHGSKSAPTMDTEPLRPNQRKLLDAAVADDGNFVIVASTGFGKTRVAFAVVAAALERH